MSAPKTSLDFATRNLIAETVRQAVQTELQHAQFTVQSEPVQQLHGPSNFTCEALCIGAVLCGAVPIDAIPLQRSDFWGQLTGRMWEAMQLAYDARLIPVVVETALARGTIAGDPEHYETILGEWAAIADYQLPLRDLSAAVLLLREHSRARRLVTLLARLADGICGGSECVDSAKAALREHFQQDSRYKKQE